MTSNIFDFNDAPRLQVIDNDQWDRRVETLRGALKSRVADLAETIFPRGHKASNQWRIGNVDGEAGESLSICLQGPDAGLWTDHATGQGGDFIALWMETQGYGPGDFRKAVDDLELHLGIKTGPKYLGAVHKVANARKEQVQKEPKPDHSLGPPTAIYHYLSADGGIIGKVHRYELANGDKTYRPFNSSGQMTPPDPRPLYRLPQIRGANTVILVEGEKCADALSSIGIEATSMMSGSNAVIEKTDLSPLAGKHVILWPDNDPPGFDLMRRVRPYLEAIGCTVSEVTLPTGIRPKWDAADCVDEHGDAAAVIATAHVPKPEASGGGKFRIMSIADMADLDPPEWKIGGVIPAHGTSAIYGPPGSLKTFACLDMGLSIASGMEWQGRDTKPGRVLYIAGEGQYGISRRVLGWCHHHEIDISRPRFSLIPQSVAMPSGELDELLRAIDTMPEPPTFIALDTITRMFGAGSQNKDDDMAGYIRATERLGAHCGAHVMSVGHSGKDKDRGLFGSMLLTGALDTMICVTRDEAFVTLCNTAPMGKQKEGEEFEDIVLASHVVRFTHRGREDSTLVLLPSKKMDEEKKNRVGKVEAQVLEIINSALAEGRVLKKTSIYAMCSADQSNVRRAMKTLTAKGLIGPEHGGDTND